MRGCAKTDDTRCGDWSDTHTILVARAPARPTHLSSFIGLRGFDFNLSLPDQHTVRWTPPAGTFSGYQMQYSHNGGSFGNTVTLSRLNEAGLRGRTYHAFSGLADGTYTYRLRAYTTVGSYTAYSDWAYHSALPIVAPSFSISDAHITEGGQLTFTVTRAGEHRGRQSVDYATVDGSGVAGSDYTATTGTVTFWSGDTTKTITVDTLDDTVYEGAETVLVNISNATYLGYNSEARTLTPNVGVITDSQGIGTIAADTDVPPAFGISDAQVSEAGNLQFTVSKAGQTAFTHSVNYATVDGSARLQDADYAVATGTLVFAPGRDDQNHYGQHVE